MKIAIDGPSGAGKSTIAKELSKRLGYLYIDTGAMYRAVGLYAVRNSINIKNSCDDIQDHLENIKIDLKYNNGTQEIYLNGENVSKQIREPEISIAASDVGTILCVRKKLVKIQQEISEKTDVIMDGRDIATAVLPDAEVKIFLTASVEERAKRRFAELQQKGISTTFDEVLNDMITRDLNDSTRAASPLVKADDAVEIVTDNLSFEEAVEKLYDLIKEKTNVD